jgi:tRNA threonylcarbamoyladenosine biosynthesis protein TsaE
VTVPPLSLVTHSAAETRAVGAALARLLPPGAVVLLHGDLGAGKTTLTQGIAHGLGIREPIQSPTFTLVGEHDGLYHLDLYRLAGEDDLDSFGWDHYLSPADAITVVEWPERAGSWLPEEYLLVQMEVTGPDQRRITLEAVPPHSDLADVITRLRRVEMGT